MIKEITLEESKKLQYDSEVVKEVLTDDYIILFNPKTGKELLSGINGKPDPFALEYPSMLDVGIMGHCLNKCEFCYQGDKQESNMSLDSFKLIIDQSREHVNQIALGGRGDPNLHEEFGNILKYCRENNIVSNYTTSGNNLTDEQIKLSQKYCGAVAVSMYKKGFTWSALSRLMESNIKTNIHYVVSKHTIDEACSLILGDDPFDGKVEFEKLNAIVFLLFKPQGRGMNLDWSPTNEQIKKFSELIKTPNCKFKVGMDSCLINKVAKARDLTPMEEMFVDTCEGSRMSCYISPRLKLMPCSFGNHDQYGISIKERPIKEVWNTGKPFIDFREVLKKEAACCPFTMKGF